jgi:hypothetical protein
MKMTAASPPTSALPN